MPIDTSARPPAMSDVALAAGVSHQTVSRVLNGHPSVRPETRERVQEAIARLGYRRNSAARTLVTRRTDTLGVVTPASALYGPTSTLVAFEEAAREAGWYVSVATMRRFTAESMRTTVEHFLDQGVDALVVIAPTREVGEAVAGLEVTVPVVLISSTLDIPASSGVRTVGVDQRLGARLATRHLLARGHSSVLHVAGPLDWYDAQDRLAGWREECAAAGVRVQEPVTAGWTADSGYEVGRSLVATGLPEAIFAANDQLALGLEHAFWEAGVQVGQDVALVGFDDEVGSAHYLPPLTTVRQDFVRLGGLAVDVVRQAIAGGAQPGAPRLVPPEIVVRRSSGV
ncbi:LacI family DNA-binding transcriptional regulator [Cellulomonas gilvus]|uniref:Transcriptional regulator, LacI family n=1 Tax=Cellulomonas gilvus (strain ATCC 13127 / NRRL B-14078) TaxID=593907 RepID=F8A394_CELGA|nr:LacI family DNA-binding transcriptional regulator [Cellulomonas gilvus]AEI13087.1 transcriptional regulator, LacI family [Cellulomonas gilvus ATCC 13127]